VNRNSSLRLALVRAVLTSPTIHSHANFPEVAKLGKRKASSEHLARPEKKVMTVSDSKLSYSPSAVAISRRRLWTPNPPLPLDTCVVISASALSIFSEQ